MEKMRLGDIAQLINGDRGKNYPSQTDIAQKGEIPFVNAGHLNGKGIDFKEMNYISEEKYNKLNSGKFQKDDILYCLRGSLGKKAIVSSNINGAIASSLVIIRPDPAKVSGEYLMFALDSPAIREQLVKANNGSSQPNLSATSVREYRVELPELSLQEEVVEKLEKVISIIDGRKQEVQLLDDLIRARFVEMFGDARENPNGYTRVPFIDIVEYMGDIGSNGANKVVVDHLDMKDEEDYAMMVRFTNFTKNDFADDVKYISKEAYDFFKKSQIFGGELIICKIGSAGQNYVMPYLNRPVSLGLNQIMVRIKDNILMPYLYQYLHTDYGEFLISGCINGAVTKTITKTELKKIPVMLPPIELQNQFADFVRAVDKSKVAIQKALDKTQMLFDSLMQEYFG